MTSDNSNLSKKEQQKLRHQDEQQRMEQAEKMKKLKKWGAILLGISVLLGGFIWIIIISSQPLPGGEVDDQGRQHETDITDVKRNSNPPTSGPHFPIWAKPGVYNQVIPDGYLIHSLEHGYVILSYNCDVKGSDATIKQIEEKKLFTKMDSSVSAPITPSTLPAEELKLPEVFGSADCKNLVKQLTEFTNSGYNRVIVVPRPHLDTKIALTAWNRIEKLNAIDKEKIETFISSFHNKGPEATME